jgi:hypothetical protein
MHIVVNCVWKCKFWDNKPIHECHISHAILENKLLPWHPSLGPPNIFNAWRSNINQIQHPQYVQNQCGQIGVFFFF